MGLRITNVELGPFTLVEGGGMITIRSTKEVGGDNPQMPCEVYKKNYPNGGPFPFVSKLCTTSPELLLPLLEKALEPGFYRVEFLGPVKIEVRVDD